MAWVDYDKVAQRYEEGRAEVAQADLWHRVVATYLPRRDRGPRVLDLGAGSGIFARAWPDWGARGVIAIDPSLPMLQEARRVGMPPQVVMANAPAEALPLSDASVDVAWLSAMLHHLADPHACRRELRRTLTPDGVVLIRSFFPDKGELGWFSLFPGVSRAAERFPTLANTTRMFEGDGFERRGVETVPTPPRRASDVADWVQRMRHADTMLSAFTDNEIRDGLAALRRRGDAELALASLHVAVLGVCL